MHGLQLTLNLHAWAEAWTAALPGHSNPERIYVIAIAHCARPVSLASLMATLWIILSKYLGQSA